MPPPPARHASQGEAGGPALREDRSWKMEDRKNGRPTAAVSELPKKKQEEAAVEFPQRQVKIEGIKFQPHLMGPVEELKSLDLTEFRRLAKEPAVAARKIKEKIDLLAEDSFAQKIKGVKSWRESRLNKLYLAIGLASLHEKKPVAQIISERNKKGEEALSEKEFEAVMELNGWLRVF